MWAKAVALALQFGFWHWFGTVLGACVLLYALARAARWAGLASFLERVSLVAFSIAAGIAAGMLCKSVHLADHLGYGEASGLVASVAAGSLTTAVTMYLVIVVIQFPAINRGMRDALQRNLFGLRNLDIQKAALQEILDVVPAYATDNANYPLILCNPPKDAKPVEIDPTKMVEVAFGLVLGRDCTSDAIVEKFSALKKDYPYKFKFVLLLEEAGSGYSIAGAAYQSDFYLVLRPSLGEKPDQNIAKFMVDMLAYKRPEIFQLFKFVAVKIEAGDNIAAMIAGLVKGTQNVALITRRNGGVLGIANLWKLVGVSYGYEIGPAGPT